MKLALCLIVSASVSLIACEREDPSAKNLRAGDGVNAGGSSGQLFAAQMFDAVPEAFTTVDAVAPATTVPALPADDGGEAKGLDIEPGEEVCGAKGPLLGRVAAALQRDETRSLTDDERKADQLLRASAETAAKVLDFSARNGVPAEKCAAQLAGNADFKKLKAALKERALLLGYLAEDGSIPSQPKIKAQSLRAHKAWLRRQVAFLALDEAFTPEHLCAETTCAERKPAPPSETTPEVKAAPSTTMIPEEASQTTVAVEMPPESTLPVELPPETSVPLVTVIPIVEVAPESTVGMAPETTMIFDVVVETRTEAVDVPSETTAIEIVSTSDVGLAVAERSGEDGSGEFTTTVPRDDFPTTVPPAADDDCSDDGIKARLALEAELNAAFIKNKCLPDKFDDKPCDALYERWKNELKSVNARCNAKKTGVTVEAYFKNLVVKYERIAGECKEIDKIRVPPQMQPMSPAEYCKLAETHLNFYRAQLAPAK